MKARRDGKKTFSVLIDREKAEMLDRFLEEQKKTRSAWLDEKIEEDLYK